MGSAGFLDCFHISYQVCLAELLSGKDGSAGVEEWTILFLEWSGGWERRTFLDRMGGMGGTPF